ncbi:hypothetical protein AB0I81_42530 [Nonomuraea sp. NPDC050404]|uniref:hypothetical protein n=1 Tax=Nonomuraea sp. NPDC050404 TaxID=3155783 RepID=UPI0033E44E5F
MRRRAQLLATVALLSGLATFAVTAPAAGPIETLHNVRDGLIGASHRFYGLAEILTGATPRYNDLA